MLQNNLIKVKNAYLANQKEVTIPYSRITERVLEVLAKQGYIGEVKIVKKAMAKELLVSLRYTEGLAHLHDLKFLSKPGRRLYAPASGLHKVRQGFGDLIVSTSKGVMSAKEAKEKGLGGELICEVF